LVFLRSRFSHVPLITQQYLAVFYFFFFFVNSLKRCHESLPSHLANKWPIVDSIFFLCQCDWLLSRPPLLFIYFSCPYNSFPPRLSTSACCSWSFYIPLSPLFATIIPNYISSSQLRYFNASLQSTHSNVHRAWPTKASSDFIFFTST
jgi:hypothetical protein